MFTLDPRLEADSIPVGRIGKISCRLINDRRFPWLILVPEVPGISEIHQLDADLQAQLARLAADLGQSFLDMHTGDKLNVAALGNVVSQLHYHLVVRYQHDAAWPGPVWGHGAAIPYTREEHELLIQNIRALAIFAV